jgi:hypothetical protein
LGSADNQQINQKQPFSPQNPQKIEQNHLLSLENKEHLCKSKNAFPQINE